MNYIDEREVTKEKDEIVRQAIRDHFNGNVIQSFIGLALVLADKLDVTYHRVERSTIHDTINNEIQKIKNVNIEMTEEYLTYKTEPSFDVTILKDWNKAIEIPKKIEDYYLENTSL